MVGFLLRQPVLLTELKESQCDCHTLCALKAAVDHTGTGVGATALGTLGLDGLYYPSGALSMPAVQRRTALIDANGLNLGSTQTAALKAMNLDRQVEQQRQQNPLYASASLAHVYQQEGGSWAKVCVCIRDATVSPLAWPLGIVSLANSHLACPMEVPGLESSERGPRIGPPTFRVGT